MMTHTAAYIQTADPYLQISDNQKGIVVKEYPKAPEEDINLSFVENILFREAAPLYYRTRVRLSFSISEEFQTHFVMIKGLIEFYRSKHFSFQYDFKQRGIETDVEVSQLAELQLFFNTVSVWLKKEIQFKNALKSVLEFENQYKIKQAAVYSVLKNTVV